MNRRISHPSSGLICFLTALCIGLLFIIIILIVTITRQGVNQMEQTMEVKLRNLSQGVQTSVEKLSQEDSRMMEKLTDMETFIKNMRAIKVISKMKRIAHMVDRIFLDDVIGSITSDIQGVLGAVARLRDEIRKENIIRDSLCEFGWKYFDYSCYYFSQRGKTWESAKKDCEKRNAHLAVITSKKENLFLWDLSHHQYLWIGLTVVDGSWKWVDGTSYFDAPRFWEPGQPAFWLKKDPENKSLCVQLSSYKDVWIDDYCFWSAPYICEKNMPYLLHRRDHLISS